MLRRAFQRGRRRRTLLAFLSAVAHLSLAQSTTASWENIGVPGWVFPTIFLVIGLLAAAGIFHLRFLRASLYGGSLVMVVWAVGLAYTVLTTGIPWPPSMLWLLYIGALKWMLADADVRLETTSKAIHDLVDDVAAGRPV